MQNTNYNNNFDFAPHTGALIFINQTPIALDRFEALPVNLSPEEIREMVQDVMG